ncbi:hypothetical protein Bca52824_022710 [Brassica carinata]|uniref:Nucleoplasmin-like domain-containing protein n=1 Tax=Brassica carinata TaxID=52824 RepID=A0A8X8ATN5_BRACI|nr:hypothetical protein Bca52824_022710 [Brassica carinata]
MEFWGAEVKAGKSLKMKPDEDCLIHLSQVCIDNGRKGETALLFVTVDGKKLVIGTLSHENIPQISLDLIFDQEFELSHSLETGSVHFIGYKSPNIDEEEYYSSSDCSSEEDVELQHSEPKAKPEEVKHESDEDDEGSDEKGLGVCTCCFPSGWMLTRMIEMMSKMVLGTKKK